MGPQTEMTLATAPSCRRIGRRRTRPVPCCRLPIAAGGEAILVATLTTASTSRAAAIAASQSNRSSRIGRAPTATHAIQVGCSRQTTTFMISNGAGWGRDARRAAWSFRALLGLSHFLGTTSP